MRRKGEVARIREDLQGHFEERLEDRGRYRALLGDGAGNVRVTDHPNRAYARIAGRGTIDHVINLKVPFRNNLPVIVAPTEESPRIWEVIGLDKYTLAIMGDYAYLPPHHQAHEFKNEDGGDDVVWVRKQQHIPMLVYPTDPPSWQLNVYQDWYQWGGTLRWYEGGITTDLSAYQPLAPPSGGLYVLISLDLASGALQYTQGDVFNLYLPPSEMEELIPAIPTNSRPLAAVLLRTTGQTELTWDDIWDVRIMQGGVGMGAVAGFTGFDNWLEVNATGTVSWAPDNVALLSNGIVQEYADPDDAFNAAGSGTCVFVPPGVWELSAAHVLPAYVSVHGLGPVSDCVLQASGNLGTLLTVVDGEASNFTIDFTPNHNGAPVQTALQIDDGVGRNVHAICNNSTYTAFSRGIRTDDSRLENCKGEAYAGSDAYGIAVHGSGSDRLFRCYGYGSGGVLGDGVGIYSEASPAGGELMWCRGTGLGIGVTSFGMWSGLGEISAWHCNFFGSSKDIDATIGTLNIYDVQYDTESGANIVQMAGDRPGKARDETITGLWTTERTVAPARIHRLTTAATGTTTELLRLISMSDATVGPEFAGSIRGRLENNAGVEHDAALWEWGWDDPTAGAEDAFMRWSLVGAGAALTPLMKLTPTALVCQGTQELDIGADPAANRWGNVWLASGHDALPDGETAFGGLFRRFVNKVGISSYTHHRGTGAGVPAGCTLTATPANLWAAWHAVYRGWFQGTYYNHYPLSATLPAGLTVLDADPVGDSQYLYARVHTTGGSKFGLWAGNFDANRNYAIGEYIYRFDVYAQGNGPETLLYTQVATSVCTAPGVGVAATFAAWVNHANTGPYGPFCPCGDGIVLLLIANYTGTTSRCYSYVIGENSATTGIGDYFLYDDAWPGSSVYGARRMGTFHRTQGFALACWDWYYLP